MWSRQQRILTVFVLYNIWYCSMYTPDIEMHNAVEDIYSLFVSEELQYQHDLHPQISTTLCESIHQSILYYKKNHNKIIERIKHYTKEWEKTPLLIRAIFISAVLECDSAHSQHEIDSQACFLAHKKVISSYLRICEHYNSKQSTSAVHAILIRLFNDLLVSR